MWSQFYASSSPSQSDIADFLSGEGSTGGDYPDVSPDAFAAALQNYSGVGTWSLYPPGDSYCDSGKTCAEQILADIHVALQNNRPPATIWYDYGVIKNAGTKLDCTTAQGCNPSSEFLTINIPTSGYGENYVVTTNYYLTGIVDQVIGPVETAAPRNVFFADPGDYQQVDSDGWAAWAYVHGTYYGDPDPPDPFCPDPSDYCNDGDGGGSGGGPPEGDAVIAGASGSGHPAKFWKRHDVVKPNPSDPAAIIADFVAAIRSTRVFTRPGMASLTLDDGRLRVREIVRVRSMAKSVPDYYILYIVDRATERLYAKASLSSEGLLMSVGLVPSGQSRWRVDSADAALRALTAAGIHAVGTPEPVLEAGPGTPVELDPSFFATDHSGRGFVIRANGSIRQQEHTMAVPGSQGGASWDWVEPKTIAPTATAAKTKSQRAGGTVR